MIFQLDVDVSEKKEKFAIDLFKSISFVKNVKVLKQKKGQELAANIRKGFADKKSIDEGKLKTFPIEELFDD